MYNSMSKVAMFAKPQKQYAISHIKTLNLY